MAQTPFACLYPLVARACTHHHLIPKTKIRNCTSYHPPANLMKQIINPLS
jgi:hypothetical protein